MRREWLNPELVNLQVNQTREELDCETENGGEKCIWPHDHICPKRGKDFGHKFGSHIAWEIHKGCCNGNGDNDDTVPKS